MFDYDHWYLLRLATVVLPFCLVLAYAGVSQAWQRRRARREATLAATTAAS